MGNTGKEAQLLLRQLALRQN